MRFRALHRIYAGLLGYTWLTCPICDQEFGGHEWMVGESSTIPAPYGRSGDRVAICPDCTRAGLGGGENIVIWTDGRVDR